MFPGRLIPPLRIAPLHLSAGTGYRKNEEKEEEDSEEEDNDSEESDEAKDKINEQKAEEKGKEEEEEKEENQEQEKKEDETERQKSRPASETQSLSIPYLSVFSGSNPDLGPQLLEAAARGKNWSPPTISSFYPPPTLWPHRSFTPQSDLSFHFHPRH